jgi:hypothetical protein
MDAVALALMPLVAEVRPCFANDERRIAMDQARFEELKAKAGTSGLSPAEADELGRLYAEEAGKPYANREVVQDLADETGVSPADEELVKLAEESGTLDEEGKREPDPRPPSPASLGELEAEEGLEHTPDDLVRGSEGEAD